MISFASPLIFRRRRGRVLSLLSKTNTWLAYLDAYHATCDSDGCVLMEQILPKPKIDKQPTWIIDFYGTLFDKIMILRLIFMTGIVSSSHIPDIADYINI